MSKVLVSEEYLEDIADAIRDKLGGSAEYTPGQMAAAIGSIETGSTPVGTIPIAANGTVDVTQYASAEVNVQPNLQAKTATQNGDVEPDSGYDGLSKVTVNVSGGGGTLISKTITQNGTYDPADDNADGYSGVVVNVSGGGGGLSLSPAETSFVNDYSRNGAEVDTSVSSSGAVSVVALKSEYYGNIYGNTAVIAALGLVLLGDFSQGGEAAGNTLADSISSYSAVILNGIYNKSRSSNYNTSMLYHAPVLGTAYWAGMKDRNTSYDCHVTFTDAQTVSLSGNKQVIIYGVP